MITTIDDDLSLCSDCTIAAVNGDFTGLDYHYGPSEADERMAAIVAGLESFDGFLVFWSDEDGEGEEDEFSTRSCDCCGTGLAGRRTRFALLGEVAS